jgi:hypothetical protein
MGEGMQSTGEEPGTVSQPDRRGDPEACIGDDESSVEVIRGLVRRLKLDASDMRQAARDAALLAGICEARGPAQSEHDIALVTGVVLAYARPFTRSDDVGALDADEWTPVDRRQAILHRTLIASRNDRYANGTRQSGRSDDTSAAFPARLSARTWAGISELAAEQERRMRASASRLEDELRRRGDGADGPRQSRQRSDRRPRGYLETEVRAL